MLQVNLDDPEVLAALKEKVTALEGLFAQQILKYSPVALANSLGVEDMVLTDLIARKQWPIAIFVLDTGRLHEESYALIETIRQHYALQLTIFFPDKKAIEPYVLAHGINGFYRSVELRKQCCHIRKVAPLKRALEGKKAWITGMRVAQSSTRKNLQAQEKDEQHGLEKFNPLAHWTEQDIWAYIHHYQVPYNPLHERFYPSIGCAPCTRAISIGEDLRAGRWWWEDPAHKECGLHVDHAVSASKQ
jgi:phosphoadenosine phosphosulfate reductase